MITEQQSWSLDIRDAFYNALSSDAYFAGYTCRKNKMLPVQTNLIPYLGIYLIDEGMTPDGDGNAGMIRFVHNVRIGMSVVQANNDSVALEQSIDKAFLAIMTRLWTDAGITNVFKGASPFTSENPEHAMIEAISRGTRRHIWGTAGANNETPMCELEYNVSATYRTEWWPDIITTLDEIDVTTGVKATDTQAEMNQRQQISVKYMLNVLRAAQTRSNGHG